MEDSQPDSCAGLDGGEPVATLDAVICTAELRSWRAFRAPDYEAENRALTLLMQTMTDSSENVLKELANTALKLCNAHSSGISILEEENGIQLFRWRAAAGTWSGLVGSTMPREQCLCSTVLDRNSAQLMDRPQRHYTAVRALRPAIAEVLAVRSTSPEHRSERFWVIAHDESRKFDREDERILSSPGAIRLHGLSDYRR